MSYFSYFPNFVYELDGKGFTVKDILRRSVFISEYKPYSELYEEYTINDSDTLQSIAEKYYGSVNYYWVVSLFNEIHDTRYEFPFSVNDLETYIDSKYGSGKNLVKHYVDIDTNLIAGESKEYYSGYVEPLNPGTVPNEKYIPVTFADYESDTNESKRSIKLLRKELLADFLKQFRRSLLNDN